MADESTILQKAFSTILKKLEVANAPLDTPSRVTEAGEKILSGLPEYGIGVHAILDHIVNDLCAGFNGSSLSPTYYGFVTGGITPAARIADAFVSLYDQNVQVHLPTESIATVVEDRALSMLLELLAFDKKQWPVRCFTTGATASNLLGLACGRDSVIAQRVAKKRHIRQTGMSLIQECKAAGIDDILILSTKPHSSIGKVANIIGLGSAAVHDVSSHVDNVAFDFLKLEQHMSRPGTASIVSVSCGEVNTGFFATQSFADMLRLRQLCDKYDAWLHVDGETLTMVPAAFGLMARVLPRAEKYSSIRACTDGLELADSIAGDGHKLLNVPYDCGFFFSRHGDVSQRVFQNVNAAYLASSTEDEIVSPLNLRIENSARFRGLPVYASLVAYGQSGFASMLARMVDLARQIAVFIRDDCPHLQLLPEHRHLDSVQGIFICVLFCAKDDLLNDRLAKEIKKSGVIYGSGTSWNDRPAVRFAVGKWDVDVDRHLALVKVVLQGLK